jgi:hypothetical protein
MGIAIQTPHVRRCGLSLFEASRVVEALAELERANANLLGADRFKLFDDGRIQPIGEIDVSCLPTGADRYPRVAEFITQANESDTVYELVWD